MNLEASITGKRQVTIPKDLYIDMDLKNTDKLVFTKNENGEIVISKKEVNTLNMCPICNREVKNDDTMVVKKMQRYHLNCWSLSDNKTGELNFTANKVNRSQIKTLERIENIKKATELEIIKQLKDNEVVINVPIKLTFMESNPGVIGMISEFDSRKIISCNIID